LQFPSQIADATVRAILEGRQTVMRKLIRPTPVGDFVGTGTDGHQETFGWNNDQNYQGGCTFVKCPLGAPGDRLWIKETFGWLKGNGVRVVFRADAEFPARIGYPDDPVTNMTWSPSLYMPRGLSRIDLEILSVRAERLQNITESEAVAEGIGSSATRECKVPKFVARWDLVHGGQPGVSWTDNPWVWRIAFRKTKP